MGTNRRRFRPPVFSRLSWAWMLFAASAAAIGAYSATSGGKSAASRIALAVGELERLARPEPPPPATTSVFKSDGTEERLYAAAPTLRDERYDGEPDFAERGDALALDDPYTEDAVEADSDEIIITVDGVPARDGSRAVAPQLASLASRDPVASIPDADSALLQKTPLGRIPKVASDGRRAMRVYARSDGATSSGPRVALIVGGLGLDPELTARAIEELPAAVALSFAPYARDLENWTAEARARGHEILIELPMEAYGGGAEGLGPAALLTTRSEAENRQRLDWLLARFGAYFAATNYQGAKFSADRNAIAAVVTRLEELGIAYFDDTGAARLAAGEAAHVATVNRVLAAKADADAKDVLRDLAALDALAQKDGAALAKAFVREATIEAIVEWAERAERKTTLAPASAVLRVREARG